MTSTDYLLPRLPFGSAEYTIVRWLKRAGDPVAAGEPLLVAVNDRVEAALPSTCAGILDRVVFADGAAVAAGALAATIAAASAAIVGDTVPSDPLISPARISPVARRIASIENIDIRDLRGTGVSGCITKADMLAALASQPLYSSPLHPFTPSPLHPFTPATPAYVLTAIDVDLEQVALAIAQHGPIFARRRLELSYRACIALAAVAALPDHPLLNSYWADSVIVVRRRVNLAVMQCDGAPTRSVCDAQDLNLRGLARAIGGAADADCINDRTFTIADLGDHVWGDPSALACGPSIRQDTAAALGIGAVRARPLVINVGGVDQLAVRRAALLTLAYDARVLDQRYADAFLRDIKHRLEHFRV